MKIDWPQKLTTEKKTMADTNDSSEAGESTDKPDVMIVKRFDSTRFMGLLAVCLLLFAACFNQVVGYVHSNNQDTQVTDLITQLNCERDISKNITRHQGEISVATGRGLAVIDAEGHPSLETLVKNALHKTGDEASADQVRAILKSSNDLNIALKNRDKESKKCG